ncbi:MAG TPA: ABC transporter permease [Anaerolineales bacterium]|nr:ABC transporter permease [Anaerolineales bacterium]
MKKPRFGFDVRKIVESRLFYPSVTLALILLVDAIFIPGFFHLEIKEGHLFGNLIDVLRNSTPIIILAMGMTLVIATGGVDLSVGAVMAIAASTACIMLNPNLIGVRLADVTREADPTYSASPLWAVFIVPLFIAVICGLWNGALVAYGKIQPMVATLILMIAGRGIAQLVTNAIKIIIYNNTFLQLGNGWVLLLPFALFIAAAVFALAWFITRRSSIGLFIESVGINARSSFYSGIDEKKIKLFAYMFCGFCAGAAGLIAVSSIRTSDANQVGLYSELDAILAVIIGGTVLGSGGRFSLLASVIGALVIQATTTSTLAFGVPASAIIAVKALVVIIVILLYSQQVQDFVRRLATQSRPKESRS